MPYRALSSHQAGEKLQSLVKIVEQCAQGTDIQQGNPLPILTQHAGKQGKYRRLCLAAGRWREQQTMRAGHHGLNRGFLKRPQRPPAQRIHHMMLQGGVQLFEGTHRRNSISSTVLAATAARSTSVSSVDAIVNW